MGLDEPELFVSLVLQDLPEEGHIVVLLEVSLDSVDDGGHPLDDQTLESVPLVQVGVHELLHRLSRKFALHSLLVVLQLLGVDVANHILQLLQSQSSDVGLAHWPMQSVIFLGLSPSE